MATTRTTLMAGLLSIVLAGILGPAPHRAVAAGPVPIGQPAPDLRGGPWINSPALSRASLRGRVVLVEFWTFG